MKKLIITLGLILIISGLKAQNATPSFYLEKAQVQRYDGLTIALGGAMIYSIASISRDNIYGKQEKAVLKCVMYAGIGVALTGVVYSSLSWKYVIKAQGELKRQTIIEASPLGVSAKITF